VPAVPESEDWLIADVASMPWPRNLFNCEWRDRAGAVEDLDLGASQVAMRSMVLGLTARELVACPYHRPDWRRAADAAVTLVEQTGQLVEEDLRRTARGMDGETAWALYSFVGQPIIWNGGDELSNGQHRVCAMKLAGASCCPIVAR
jgi:hypothetical protein